MYLPIVQVFCNFYFTLHILHHICGFYVGGNFFKDGVHQCREKKGISDPDQIKLMQSQDKKYVEYRRIVESKKAQRLKDNLHLIQNGQRAKHTFFVDSKKEGTE